MISSESFELKYEVMYGDQS